MRVAHPSPTKRWGITPRPRSYYCIVHRAYYESTAIKAWNLKGMSFFLNTEVSIPEHSFHLRSSDQPCYMRKHPHAHNTKIWGPHGKRLPNATWVYVLQVRHLTIHFVRIGLGLSCLMGFFWMQRLDSFTISQVLSRKSERIRAKRYRYPITKLRRSSDSNENLDGCQTLHLTELSHVEWTGEGKSKTLKKTGCGYGYRRRFVPDRMSLNAEGLF
jgi:hypothetical protein